MDDPSRDWAKRFQARIGKMPNDLQAAVCSATMHYLKGLAKSGTRESLATIAAMRAMPVEDFFAKHGAHPRGQQDGVRPLRRAGEDAGRVEGGRGIYLVLTGTVPADQAFRPVAEGGCPAC